MDSLSTENNKKQSIKIIIDGKEKRFSSQEELEAWAASFPDGKTVLEALRNAKKGSPAARSIIRIRHKGEEIVFNSEEEFDKWLVVHPEFSGTAEQIKTSLREVREDDPKIIEAINEISNRLKISEEMSESQVLELCRSFGISESGQKAVILRLGFDSRFVSKRKGALGFLSVGELCFSARK